MVDQPPRGGGAAVAASAGRGRRDDVVAAVSAVAGDDGELGFDGEFGVVQVHLVFQEERFGCLEHLRRDDMVSGSVAMLLVGCLTVNVPYHTTPRKLLS